MQPETVLSIAALAGFIWATRFLIPKAVRQHDALALTSAVLVSVFALLVWLLVGVSARSAGS